MYQPATSRGCHICAILCLSLLTSYTSRAYARQADTGASQRRKVVGLLDSNPALMRPITIIRPRIGVGELVNRMAKATGRHLQSEDAESSLRSCFVACTEEPTNHLMDAIAVIRANRWHKDVRNNYLYGDVLGISVDILVPESQRNKDQLINGVNLMSEISRLDPTVAQKMVSGELLSPPTIPPPVRDAIFRILQDSYKFLREQDPTLKMVTDAEFDSGMFSIALELQEVSARLRVTSNIPGIISGQSSTDIPDGAANCIHDGVLDTEALRISIRNAYLGKGDKTYVPTPYDYGWRDDVPAALKRVVTVDKRGALLTDVLADLHARYKVPIIADDDRAIPEKVDVHIPPMPLYRAMDRLEKIYPGLHWEYRKYGFIVCRSEKMNPDVFYLIQAGKKGSAPPLTGTPPVPNAAGELPKPLAARQPGAPRDHVE